MSTKQVLKIKDVIAQTQISKTQIYRLISQKKFPAPIKMSDRLTGWDADEINEWLENKFATAPRVTNYAVT